MLKTRIERPGNTCLLVLEGEMVIDHAEELKKVLLTALESRGSLDLNLEGVSKVDLFGIQVLCAAHRYAMKADGRLSLTGRQPEALRNAIVMAGYGSKAACSIDVVCPWNEK